MGLFRAAMAEALRLQQIELDREKTELEQVKLATSMGPVSSPGDSDASVVKREQELLAEREVSSAMEIDGLDVAVVRRRLLG